MSTEQNENHIVENESSTIAKVTTNSTTSVKPKAYLEEDVKLKTFVIGIGNAGNQTVVKAHKAGMQVFAINSSIKDLSDQIVDEDIPSFIVGDEARGAGKNIEKGKALFKTNGRELFQLSMFIDKIQTADVIVVTGATGGGTGASVAPEVCKILVKMFPKKIIIFFGITPKDNDSTQSMINTLRCVDEVKSLNIPYSFDDLSFFEDQPNDMAFTQSDNHVVESIKAYAGMFLNVSNSQMIDENDMKSVISEPGLIAAYMVNGVSSRSLENATMQSMIIEKIKKSPAIMIQKDGIAKQMAIIVNCPEDIIETTRTGNYSELISFIGGKPRGYFENYSISNGTSGQFIVILSGMTFPYNRISQYTEAIKKEEENLQRVKNINLSDDINQISALIANTHNDKLTSDTSVSANEVAGVLDDFF